MNKKRTTPHPDLEQHEGDPTAAVAVEDPPTAEPAGEPEDTSTDAAAWSKAADLDILRRGIVARQATLDALPDAEPVAAPAEPPPPAPELGWHVRDQGWGLRRSVSVRRSPGGRVDVLLTFSRDQAALSILDTRTEWHGRLTERIRAEGAGLDSVRRFCSLRAEHQRAGDAVTAAGEIVNDLEAQREALVRKCAPGLGLELTKLDAELAVARQHEQDQQAAQQALAPLLQQAQAEAEVQLIGLARTHGREARTELKTRCAELLTAMAGKVSAELDDFVRADLALASCVDDTAFVDRVGRELLNSIQPAEGQLAAGGSDAAPVMPTEGEGQANE